MKRIRRPHILLSFYTLVAAALAASGAVSSCAAPARSEGAAVTKGASRKDVTAAWGRPAAKHFMLANIGGTKLFSQWVYPAEGRYVYFLGGGVYSVEDMQQAYDKAKKKGKRP